ncbi:hypothetical protein K0U83_21395 [bacterium]|nr:hypothetical protein [bacterium]
MSECVCGFNPPVDCNPDCERCDLVAANYLYKHERDQAVENCTLLDNALTALEAENARLRAIIDTLTAKAPATASLAVFKCSRCRKAVDTVYESGSGANVEHVCVDCATAGGGNDE